MKKLLTVVGGACCLLLVLFVAKTSLAQPSTALSISPPLFELSANPGDTITNSIRVDNLTDTELHISVDKKNFSALGEEGQVDLTEESGAFSLASWITTEPASATIPGRGSQTFTYTIKVPANAEPGGHFGSIIFKTDAIPVEGGSGAAVAQELGALLLVKVAGDIREDAAIESFTTNGIWEKGPVEFSARLKNRGNVHFKPRSTVTITNMAGDQAGTVQLSENNILPNSIRNFTTSWNPGRFSFGRYTANLTVVYGSENTILTTSTTFWIIPYKLILLVILIAAGLGYLIWHYRERLKAAYKALRGN